MLVCESSAHCGHLVLPDQQAERFDTGSDDETDDTASTYSATLLPQKQVRVTFNNIIMQLRKVANHPYLIEYPLTDGMCTARVASWTRGQ